MSPGKNAKCLKENLKFSKANKRCFVQTLRLLNQNKINQPN